MSGASPYRIAAERPIDVETIAPRAAERIRAPESEADIETVAGECDMPQGALVFPTADVLGGFVISGIIAVASTVIVLLITG